MNPSSSARHFRDALGFFPTAAPKDAAAEWDVYCRVHERTVGWLRSHGLNSSVARGCMHELCRFAWEESRPLFEHARGNGALVRLLPSPEACHSFVLAIALSLVSEEAKEHERARVRAHGQGQGQRKVIKGGGEAV